jgi:hypothetical protein
MTITETAKRAFADLLVWQEGPYIAIQGLTTSGMRWLLGMTCAMSLPLLLTEPEAIKAFEAISELGLSTMTLL